MGRRVDTGIRPSVAQATEQRREATALLAAVAECPELHMAYRINRALGLGAVDAATGVIVKHCHPDVLPMGDPRDLATTGKRERLLGLSRGLASVLEQSFATAVEAAKSMN